MCYPTNKKKITYDQSLFIDNCIKKHGDKYDYTKVKYINSRLKVEIVCKKHGSFLITPKNHNRGVGCARCFADSNGLTSEDFFLRCATLHNNKFDYTNTKFTKTKEKILVKCKQHGEFSILASNHIAGIGCKKCTKRISKPESDWLDSLNINDVNTQCHVKINGKRYNVDGFSKDKNCIFEFYGDYWHGNPTKYKPEDFNQISKKSFGQLYQEVLNRNQEFVNAGYNLLYIWEFEFKNGNPATFLSANSITLPASLTRNS